MMQGDPKIDDLMRPVNAAIRRHVKDAAAVTDIYNRAYEAVMEVQDALNVSAAVTAKQIAENAKNLQRAEKAEARAKKAKDFIGHIMMLGLLRGSPRLRDEALKILDGFEASGIEDSVTQDIEKSELADQVMEVIHAAISGDCQRYLNYDLQGNRYCKWGIVEEDIRAILINSKTSLSVKSDD